MSPQLKTLEHYAQATGSAFGFQEQDYEYRYTPPARPGRMVVLALGIGGAVAAVAHHLGWTQVVASLGGWRCSV